jgi:hypothetical protein
MIWEHPKEIRGLTLPLNKIGVTDEIGPADHRHRKLMRNAIR